MTDVPPPLSCSSCGKTHITFGYDEAKNSPSITVDTVDGGFDIGLNHDKSKGTLRCSCRAETDLTDEQLFFFLTVGGQ